MYTNHINHGGYFGDVIDSKFAAANSVSIASGYVSLSVIKKYKDRFIDIAESGGVSRLLLGMAFYEGLEPKLLAAVRSLNASLLKCQNSSGVYVCNGRSFHGKVYCFRNGDRSQIYVGSSNFSLSGLRGNLECTVPVSSVAQKTRITSFLSDLYSHRYSVTIDRAAIKEITGDRLRIPSRTKNHWAALGKYDPGTIATAGRRKVTIPLSELAKKEKSNLNVYFGKGRLNRTTGKITPRPWYELELIANQRMRSQASYPRGEFLAYTDDGLIIPMRTQGDYFKNIRSKNNLQIFGLWLKGKLEKSGCLARHKLITPEVLEEYGNDELVLYEIGDREYFMTF